ncbi:hypothetical protein Tco_1536221 [Tanacetum coccineum]
MVSHRELEAEVDQNGVDRKHDEIERKNLLIANDILIADCLSKEVFYVATNSELNLSSFTKMHDAHTCDNHDLSRLVKPLVLTYESVVMYGLCVYMRYVDCVRVGNKSIERDLLIGIGLVMDLVKFLSFTFGGKEMTFVVFTFLR